MASSTKILETIRGRKRAKLLTARTKRIRREANKKAIAAPDSLRRFIAGAAKKPVTHAASSKKSVTK